MKSDIASIRRIFSTMERDGLDVSEPLQFGYFFFHSTAEPLLKVASWLADRDYTIADLSDRDDGTWVLNLSKVERHTPETLHQRNLAMNRLAEEFGVDDYDGWDVGEIED